VVGRSQQLLRVDFEKQPDHELLAQMLGDFERVLPGHDAVLFSDYGKGGLAHIGRMIELARAAGKPALVDPKGRDFSRYSGASVITPNRSELAQAFAPWHSEAELAGLAARLREDTRIDNLLLTRSEEGMTLFDAQGALHVPAQARQVFDVTGAGDTVIAAMAAMLAAGLTPREAVPIANRAAGIVVSRFGTASVGYDELFAPEAQQ
jgi:rfaE bifunctional protein kinase chain/domain